MWAFPDIDYTGKGEMSSFVLCVRNQNNEDNEFRDSVATPSYLMVPETDDIPR